MKKPQELSFDQAAVFQISHAQRTGLELIWDRLEAQEPQCGFGTLGLCCRHCVMGPCRIDPLGDGPKKGVCGATADTLVARHLCRMIAAGAAAHSDHGRRPAILLKEVALGENSAYTIKDEEKLRAVAARLGISPEGEVSQVALAVAEVALSDFGKQDTRPLRFLEAYAPKKRLEHWQKLEEKLLAQTGALFGVLPRSIDREVVDIMHRTTMGMDHDPASLLLQGVRCALSDGWGGSLIATEIQDILFGTPYPRKVRANLGVLKEEAVNIVVHGHEPVLSEMIVQVAQEEELVKMAREMGAEGINVVGLCCTGNEILLRQGVPVAGNELHSELVLTTGLCEAMVVDVQCIYPALPRLAQCFHTKFISTSDQAKFPGAVHIQFFEEKAAEVARAIVRLAVENFKNRDPQKVHYPRIAEEALVGFSVEALLKALGGSVKPLVDAIAQGVIKGVAGIVGCNNPKVRQDYFLVSLCRELLKRDILVVGTGCWAIAAAKAGLMKPEAAAEAGPGVKQLCETLGIPPALHMGSCVDCSRMLVLLGAVADHLSCDISDLPVAGSAPEWTTEKAVSIGTYFVASGVPVHLWPAPPVLGSPAVTKLLTQELDSLLGGFFFVEEEPAKAARKMEEVILARRKKLGLG